MQNFLPTHCFTLSCLLVFSTLSCNLTRNATDELPRGDASKEWSEASFSVVSAGIVGDSIWTVVQYGGGCAEHAFELESAGPMLKSLPPKQPIRWVHRSPGDPCRAMLTDTVKASLLTFRGTPHGTTVLLLSGHEGNLLYTYH